MSKNKNIDDLFREKLGNFEQFPPDNVWEGISSGLDEKSGKKLVPLFWRYAAAILLLVAIGTSWLLYRDSDNEVPVDLTTENREPQKSIPQPEQFQEPGPTQKNENTTGKVTKSVSSGPGELPAKQLEEPDFLAAGPDKETSRFREDESSQDQDITLKTESRIIVSDVIDHLPHQIDPPENFSDLIQTQLNAEKVYSWEDLGLKIPEEPSKTEKQNFSIAAIFSPVYSYRDLGNVSSSLNKTLNESETGMITYAGGFNIGYRASKRFSIHSGIMYSRIGVGVNDILAASGYTESPRNDLVWNRNASSVYLVNNSIGSIENGSTWKSKMDTESAESESPVPISVSEMDYLNSQGFYAPEENYIPDDGSINQYFQYLEVPLMMKYIVIDRTVDIKLLGGMSTNFLMGNTVKYTEGGETDVIGSTADVRTVNYTGNIGVGFDYGIREKFHFLFEPQFKYYLNSINTDNLIQNRPYTFGLYSGFIYLF